MSALKGALAGYAVVVILFWYADWFDAHHIVACSDTAAYTAVTRWEWVKSWVLPVNCG
jgi:hypothetical protein